MLTKNRMLSLGIVLALAVGSLGILSVGAQDDGPAWLGVSIHEVRRNVVVISVVPDSPADEAGLEEDDIIRAIDDNEIETADQLIDVIQSYEPGDRIVVTVERDDEMLELSATLVARPEDLDTTLPHVDVQPPVSAVLNFMGLNTELTDDGLEINYIEDDSPFADVGLEAGDVITAINGEEISDMYPTGIMRLMRLDEGEMVLTVLRDGEELEVTVDLSEMMADIVRPHVEIRPMDGAMPPTQLGISFVPVTPELAEEEDLDVEEGALVREVFDDTPAAEAGLEAGDIILAVDDDAVDEEHTLLDRLHAYEEGDVITLTVMRDGDEIDLEVELGPRASFRGMPGFRFEVIPGTGRGRGEGSEQGMRFRFFDGEKWQEFSDKFGPGMHFRFFNDEDWQQFLDEHPFAGEMFGHMMPGGGMPGENGDTGETEAAPAEADLGSAA
jgi:S1-C subfamily serine protease